MCKLTLAVEHWSIQHFNSLFKKFKYLTIGGPERPRSSSRILEVEYLTDGVKQSVSGILIIYMKSTGIMYLVIISKQIRFGMLSKVQYGP